ncbi:MAG TPA: hypothetical protein VGV87_03925, partial [Blastocatellia bacterium]|nr:hypothetical protein [Blastocatellia bacterium]
MADYPQVITEFAYTTDPAASIPVWEAESAYVKSSSISRGRDSELDEMQPGTCADVLRNTTRRFDPTYSSGPHFNYLLPMRRERKYVSGPLLGVEFYGDFETANT